MRDLLHSFIIEITAKQYCHQRSESYYKGLVFCGVIFMYFNFIDSLFHFEHLFSLTEGLVLFMIGFFSIAIILKIKNPRSKIIEFTKNTITIKRPTREISIVICSQGYKEVHLEDDLVLFITTEGIRKERLLETEIFERESRDVTNDYVIDENVIKGD